MTQKMLINAQDPESPTDQEDADDPADAVILPVGSSVVWTYLVENLSTSGNPLMITDITDFGSVGSSFAPVAIDDNADGFNPVFATLTGMLLLDETVTAGMVLGMIIIVIGVWLVNQQEKIDDKTDDVYT